jgi:hypothetical protein
VANTYSVWVRINETSNIKAGLGYTMKGSGVGYDTTPNSVGLQNYAFIGKPNNNTIKNLVSPNNELLTGNPYPSSLDSDEFIRDNIPLLNPNNKPSGAYPTSSKSIDGTLYFWDHYDRNDTHILKDYEGGYAAYTLAGGVFATTPPETEDHYIITGGNGSKRPGRYIPVGQGFFVTASPNGGMVTLNNKQRVFEREDSPSTQFFRTKGESSTKTKTKNSSEDVIKRLRLNFKTPEGAIRPLLLAFVPNNMATDDFDYGYDALNFDDFPSDLSWRINDKDYIIQGVGDFDKLKQYPLNMILSDNGNIEISLEELENFDTPINVFVYDALLGTYTRINKKSYQVNLDANTYSNRFFIAFQHDNNSTLSIEDMDNQNIIVNYLSSTDEIYVKTTNNIEIRQIYLINMIGQAVKSWNATNLPMSNNEIRIPVSKISEGNYILKVETNVSTVNKKIIIAN